MKKADLLIAHVQGTYNIKVEGRANFECAPPLRNLSANLDKNFENISIDLGLCTGMDSTFMGVLAMLGLQARSRGVVEIVNAGPENQKLLQGLGIHDLFSFVMREMDISVGAAVGPSEYKVSDLDRAEMVYTAHDTLIQANESNREKFDKVVEFAKKDLDKLKDQQGKSEDK